MKKEFRKLNLNRETIMPLHDDALTEVNGGITPISTVTVSSGACIAASIYTASQVVLKTIDVVRTK
jgi:hypothetical protein